VRVREAALIYTIVPVAAVSRFNVKRQASGLARLKGRRMRNRVQRSYPAKDSRDALVHIARNFAVTMEAF